MLCDKTLLISRQNHSKQCTEFILKKSYIIAQMVLRMCVT